MSPTALLALGIALGSATPARATFFRTNTTFDGTNPQNEEAGATGSAVVTIVAGASLTGGVRAHDYSTVNIYGGTVASVAGEQFGTVNIYGGSIPGYVETLDSSTVNIYGGSIGGLLSTHFSSTIHLFGCNLRLMPVSPGSNSFSLTGTLQDGTVLNNLAFVDPGSSIQLHQTDTQPPRIDAPPDLTVPADPGQCSASNPFLGIVPVSDNCGTADAIPSTRGPFPLGVTLITWTAIDAAGLQTQASTPQKVTVIDTQAATISGFSATPSRLWPPNHKMVDVTVNYTLSDNCGTATGTLSVSNNETGAADAVVVDEHHVRLLAERAGKGSGRVYTIKITGQDRSGNTASQTVTVTVPHNG